MRFREPRTLAALALAAISAACEPKTEPLVGAWLPLDAGRTWHYRTDLVHRKQQEDLRLRVLGARSFSEVGREGIAVEERRSTEPPAWSGRDEMEVAVWIADGDWVNRVYLQYDDGRLIAQSGFEDRQLLPSRVRPGQTWKSRTFALVLGDEADSGYGHEHRLSLEPEPIVVPAGTFRDCLRVDTESVLRGGGAGAPDITYAYSEWYARGVGLVRMESWGDRERTEVRSRTALLEWGRGAPRNEASNGGLDSPGFE